MITSITPLSTCFNYFSTYSTSKVRLPVLSTINVYIIYAIRTVFIQDNYV